MAKSVTSRRKNGWIIFLGLVLAMLVAAIMQLQHKDQRMQQARVLLSAELAHSIDIVTPEQLISFSKREGRWQMIHPVNAPVNQERIEPLLSLLVLPGSQRYPISEVDPVELGLSPPVANVKINDLEFGFGNPATGEHNRYMLHQDSVYIVDDIIFLLINSGSETFILEDTTTSADQ